VPRLSAARAAAKRRQIIDAALSCFAEQGFRKSTLQDVVRVSGLSPGSIYCHFASKEAIVYAAVEARHQDDLQTLDAALDANSLDEALKRLANAFFPLPEPPNDRGWRRLAVELWAESLHDPTLLEIVREGVAKPLRLLTDLLRRAQRRGDVAGELDPKPTARLLIAAFQGLALQQTWDASVDARACVSAIRRLLLGDERPTDRRSLRRRG
jgi:AcrR family transcriptional regulator